MIKNHDVFDREFIPDDLHHRDGQIRELIRALGGIPNPKRHQMVTIYGPSGSGKTTIARHVARQFEAEFPELRVGYIDCIECSTQTRALQTLFEQTRPVPAIPPSPNRRIDYLAALRESSDPVLAIVDELDFLEEPQLIHALDGTQGIWTVCIGIDETELLANLHPGIRTHLQSAQCMRLSRFTDAHLKDILWSRVELGLAIPEIVEPAAVKAIIERADGNASIAIAILRACVHRLNPDQPELITPEMVEDIQETVEKGVRSRYIDRLDTHPRLLYQLIDSDDGLTGRQLKQEYEARAPKPRCDSQRQTYLKQLQQYGLVYTTGRGRGTRYHAYS